MTYLAIGLASYLKNTVFVKEVWSPMLPVYMSCTIMEQSVLLFLYILWQRAEILQLITGQAFNMYVTMTFDLKIRKF